MCDNIEDFSVIIFSYPAIPSELFDVKKLHGREGEYRIRIGNIRVLYAVLWDSSCIEITDVNWRGRVYK
ncbi:MAG: hypothetical protein QXS81_04145 [Candidatus Micrarchaeaceae archaeon]